MAAKLGKTRHAVSKSALEQYLYLCTQFFEQTHMGPTGFDSDVLFV